MEDSTRGSGWITYSGIMLVIGGLSSVLTASRAWRYDETTIDTLFFDDNLTFWGWALFAIGIITVIAGASVLAQGGAQWSRWFGVVVAALVIFSRLSFMFTYPWESLLQILLAALVIYGLVVHGDPLYAPAGTSLGTADRDVEVEVEEYIVDTTDGDTT